LRRREELNLIEARRNDRISEIENTWARLQEEQRQQDDALIAFISVARERRAYEREQEALELAAEAAERERKARFDELELLREKRIRARDQKSKASAEMQAAEEEIVRHRLAELDRVRRINERRIEDEHRERCELARVKERDRILIHEARLRRAAERERQRQEDAEAEARQHKVCAPVLYNTPRQHRVSVESRSNLNTAI